MSDLNSTRIAVILALLGFIPPLFQDTQIAFVISPQEQPGERDLKLGRKGSDCAAPEMKALKLESDLRNGGVAVLMVNDNGRVALKDVVPDN